MSPPGLQKDRDRRTGGPKEGLCSIGRCRIKYQILVRILIFSQMNSILEASLGQRSIPKYNTSSIRLENVSKPLNYLLFIAKIVLGRIEMTVSGVRKKAAFLQPYDPKFLGYTC